MNILDTIAADAQRTAALARNRRSEATLAEILATVQELRDLEEESRRADAREHAAIARDVRSGWRKIDGLMALLEMTAGQSPVPPRPLPSALPLPSPLAPQPP